MNEKINLINYTYKHRSCYCQSSAPLSKSFDCSRSNNNR